MSDQHNDMAVYSLVCLMEQLGILDPGDGNEMYAYLVGDI